MQGALRNYLRTTGEQASHWPGPQAGRGRVAAIPPPPPPTTAPGATPPLCPPPLALPPPPFLYLPLTRCASPPPPKLLSLRSAVSPSCPLPAATPSLRNPSLLPGPPRASEALGPGKHL